MNLLQFCQTEFSEIRQSLDRIENKMDTKMESQRKELDAVKATVNKATGAWKTIIVVFAALTAISACARLFLGLP